MLPILTEKIAAASSFPIQLAERTDMYEFFFFLFFLCEHSAGSEWELLFELLCKFGVFSREEGTAKTSPNKSLGD